MGDPQRGPDLWPRLPCGTLGRMSDVLRRPLLAVPVLLTAVAGLAIVGIGLGTVAANARTFGLGVAAVLVGYGLMLLLVAWAVTKRQHWALGLVVASSLLHLLVVGSFLTTADRAQFVGSLLVLPVVLATVVTAVLAVGRRELDRVG